MRAGGWIRRKRGVRALLPRFLAAAALILLLAAVFFPLLDAGESQLSAYSGHWNDLSELRKMATGLGLSSRALLTGPRALSDADPGSSVLVIMGVERAYSAEEL